LADHAHRHALDSDVDDRTFAFMDAMGFTLNNITMLGLILAIRHRRRRRRRGA